MDSSWQAVISRFSDLLNDLSGTIDDFSSRLDSFSSRLSTLETLCFAIIGLQIFTIILVVRNKKDDK